MISSPGFTPFSGVPGPGRLALQCHLPGTPPRQLAASGRAAMGELRAQLLAREAAPAPGLLARLRRPARQQWAELTHYVAGMRDGATETRFVVSLALDNAEGGTARLSWSRQGREEMLRWSVRGGPGDEDGACLGPAAVAAALERPDSATAR